VSTASLTDTEARQAAHIRRVRAISLPGSFWDTPELEVVQRAAQARSVHPDAVLGITLARVSALVDPSVVVMTGDEGHVCLSHYAGIVASPGGGKDRAIDAAETLLPFPEDPGNPTHQVNLGSGEGLVDAYLETDPDEGFVQVRRKVCAIQAESTKIFTLMDRHGSALAATLLEAWGAAPLGEDNARSGGRSRRLGRDSYRLALALGFQPEMISELLRRKGTGFPHRFVLHNALPETRRGSGGRIAPLSDRTQWLSSLQGTRIALPSDVLGQLEDLSEEQLYSIDDPEADTMDSHLYVVLVKLSALLALLHGRAAPTPDDFRRAQQIAEASRLVREYAHILADREDQEEAYRTGNKLVIADRVREEGKKHRQGTSTLLSRAILMIVKKVSREGLSSESDAKQAINSRVMRELKSAGIASSRDEVLEKAIKARRVERGPKGIKIPA